MLIQHATPKRASPHEYFAGEKERKKEKRDKTALVTRDRRERGAHIRTEVPPFDLHGSCFGCECIPRPHDITFHLSPQIVFLCDKKERKPREPKETERGKSFSRIFRVHLFVLWLPGKEESIDPFMHVRSKTDAQTEGETFQILFAISIKLSRSRRIFFSSANGLTSQT